MKNNRLFYFNFTYYMVKNFPIKEQSTELKNKECTKFWDNFSQQQHV